MNSHCILLIVDADKKMQETETLRPLTKSNFHILSVEEIQIA